MSKFAIYIFLSMFACVCVVLFVSACCVSPQTRIPHPQKRPATWPQAPVLLQFDATDELSKVLKRWVFSHTSRRLPHPAIH